MKKSWILLLNIIILAMIITACGKGKEVNNEENDNNDNNEIVEPEDEKEKFLFNYPLTGIGTNNEIHNRAIAVVVNNHPKARPQTGLTKADIVYEFMAEGRVTRFLAIFQSEYPEKVGPVRSARNYFINTAKGYDSLFIAHGYSPDAHEMLLRGEIDELNGISYDGSLFKRSSDRYAPHNSYITAENIKKGAEQRNYNLTKIPASHSFIDEEELELNGDPATKISISYSSPMFNSKFEYDQNAQKYIRFSDGEQTVDFETKEPVLVDNIFIAETEHTVVDYEGRLSIDLSSGGKGYLIRKGQYEQVEWRNESGRIVPTKNGSVVPFLEGKTWVNIVPKSPGLIDGVAFETN